MYKMWKTFKQGRHDDFQKMSTRKAGEDIARRERAHEMMEKLKRS